MADQGNASHPATLRQQRAGSLRLEFTSFAEWQRRARCWPADALAILVGETLCGARPFSTWIADPVFVLDPACLRGAIETTDSHGAELRGNPRPVVVIEAGAAAGQLVAVLQGVRRDRIYVPPTIWLGLCRMALLPAQRSQASQMEWLGCLLAGWIAGLPRLRGLGTAAALDPLRRRDLAVWRALIWSSVQTGASLGDAARHASVRLTQGQRLLRAGLGISPSRYRMELRLRTAAARIVSASGRCDMLAADLNYASPSQFSADYRRLFGVPPSRTLCPFDEPEDRGDEALMRAAS